MSEEISKDQTHKEHLKKVFYFSFLGAILLMVGVVTSIYATDMSLFQGYLKAIKTQDTAALELQFEHLLVIDTSESTVKMELYVNNLDNLGSEKIEGVDLIFDDFPSYLNLTSFEVGQTGWNPFESLADIAAGFQSSDPHLGLFGNSLSDGKLITLNFSVGSGFTVTPAIVNIRAVFSNSSNNYETGEGQFLIRPGSDFTFDLPDRISTSSVIDIPIKIAGVSSTKPIYGFNITMENVPDYMVLDTSGVIAGSGISSWNLSSNLGNEDNGYAEDIIMAVGLNMAQTTPFTSATDTLLTFKFTIDTSQTIEIPEDPIIVNGYVTDVTGEHYMLPGIISFGNAVLEPQASDICSYETDGSVSSSVKDNLVAIADLHCMVTEWDQEGEDLPANIYKADHLGKVNIKDLTVLLSQWSREPEIESITPQSGPVTTTFDVNGQYFYPGHPTGVVMAYLKDKNNPDNVLELNIIEHTDTSMKLNIPTNIPVGDYYLRITVGDELVTTVSGFEVTAN